LTNSLNPCRGFLEMICAALRVPGICFEIGVKNWRKYRLT
jgi:hypothetical protein